MIIKSLVVVLLLVIFLIFAVYVFLQTPIFGAHATAEMQASYSESPQFNAETGEFHNRRPQLYQQMTDDSSLLVMLREWFRAREYSQPDTVLPEQTPDLELFLQDDNLSRAIWLGHSTVLLRSAGITILVDPVFSKAASPLSFIAQRFQPSVLALHELPPIDVVLISHDHYDHLDMQSIRYLATTDAEFLAPLGVAPHLLRWGVSQDRITERDWWQNYTVGAIEFTATPAQHFSGRDGIKNNRSLWSSWVIQSDESNIFFSGDSGFDTHFKAIGERFGPFDLAFIEDGQYDKSWSAVHLFPEEAAQAAIELQARHIVPIHWGMYELAYHTWFDPITRLDEAMSDSPITLLTPMIGELLTLDDQISSTQWWKDLLPEKL